MSDVNQLSQSSLEELYLQLADLLQSGVNLPTAVERLSGRVGDLSRSQTQRASRAFEEGDRARGFELMGLPGRDVRILEAGARAGGLRDSCDRLAEVYAEWNDVKTTALTSLVWIFGAGLVGALVPAVLIFMGIGIRVASRTGEPGPAILYGAVVGGAVFLAIAVVWALFLWYLASAFNRMFLGEEPGGMLKPVLSLPVVGTIYEHLQFGLLYLQWRLLYAAGVAPDQILLSLDETFQGDETVLPYAANRLEEGAGLRELEILSDFFPENDYGQLCTGEEAGQLGEALDDLQRRHFQSFIEMLENLPQYMKWVLMIVYGGAMFLAFLALLYLIATGSGLLTTSALPEGALP